MERGQLDDHGQDGLITSRILDGAVWEFAQTKYCSLLMDREVWGLVWCCCPRNPPDEVGDKKKINWKKIQEQHLL